MRHRATRTDASTSADRAPRATRALDVARPTPTREPTRAANPTRDRRAIARATDFKLESKRIDPRRRRDGDDDARRGRRGRRGREDDDAARGDAVRDERAAETADVDGERTRDDVRTGARERGAAKETARAAIAR
jgi:hypothetical protein